MADQLAAALDGHQVTDEEGKVEESETPDLESAPENQTTEDESAPVETPPVQEEEASKASEPEDGEPLAEDESGKKYVPEKRFNQVYGKMKDYERQLEEQEAQKAKGEALLQQKPKSESKPVKVDKADILELKMTLPQFDPNKEEYSPELDKLGFNILRANPGMTPLEAGHEALKLAKQLAKKEALVREEARSVKSQQSDSGLTTRVVSRGQTQIDPNSMTEQELEAYMKQNGMW